MVSPASATVRLKWNCTLSPGTGVPKVGMTFRERDLISLCPEPDSGVYVTYLAYQRSRVFGAGRVAHRSAPTHKNKWGTAVRNSEYLRAQARLYRDIAKLMSDRLGRDQANASAADYLEKAEQAEQDEKLAETRAAPRMAG